MNRLVLPILIPFVLGACTGDAGTSHLQHPVFRVARNNVFALGDEQAGVQGTGFVLRHGGHRYLVSSFHVVSGLENPTALNDRGHVLGRLRVLATDRHNDVVVMGADQLHPAVVGLRPAESYVTSQRVFLVGFPNMSWKESHLNFAAGFISDAVYHAPALMGTGDVAYIQATTAVNLGHSGSPLLNQNAEALGVIAWRYEPGTQIQGGNYAVPIRHALSLIGSIEKAGQSRVPRSSSQACRDNATCRGLTYCLEGTCQRLRRAGERCTYDDDCYLPHVCHEQKCEPPRLRGQPCSGDHLCRLPNVCILGSCLPVARLGDACGEDQDCLWPLACVNLRCAKAAPRQVPPKAKSH